MVRIQTERYPELFGITFDQSKIRFQLGTKEVEFEKKYFLINELKNLQLKEVRSIKIDLRTEKVEEMFDRRKYSTKIDLSKFSQSDQPIDDTINLFETIISKGEFQKESLETILREILTFTKSKLENFELVQIFTRYFEPKSSDPTAVLSEVNLLGLKDEVMTLIELLFVKSFDNSDYKLKIEWVMDPPDKLGYLSDEESKKLTGIIKDRPMFKVDPSRTFHVEFLDIIKIQIKFLTENIPKLIGKYSPNTLDLQLTSSDLSRDFPLVAIEYNYFLSSIQLNIPGPTLGIYSRSEIIKAIVHACYRSDFNTDDSIETLDDRFTGNWEANIAIFEEMASNTLIKLGEDFFKEVYISSNVNSSKLKHCINRDRFEKIKTIKSISDSKYLSKVFDVGVIFPRNSSKIELMNLIHMSTFLHFLNAKPFFLESNVLDKIEKAFSNKVLRNKIIYSLISPRRSKVVLKELSNKEYIVVDLERGNSAKDTQKRIIRRFIVERTFATFITKFVPSKLVSFQRTEEPKNHPLNWAISLLQDTKLWKSVIGFIEPKNRRSRSKFVLFCNKVEDSIDQGRLTEKDISKFWALVQFISNLTTIPNQMNITEKLNSWVFIDKLLPLDYVLCAINHSIFYSAPIVCMEQIKGNHFSEIAKNTDNLQLKTKNSEITDFFIRLAKPLSKKMLDSKIRDFFLDITHYLPHHRLLSEIYGRSVDEKAYSKLGRAIISLFSLQYSILLELGLGFDKNSQISFGRCIVGTPKDTLVLNLLGYLAPFETYEKTKFSILHRIRDIASTGDIVHFAEKVFKTFKNVEVFPILEKNGKSYDKVHYIDRILSGTLTLIICHGRPGKLVLQLPDREIEILPADIIAASKKKQHPVLYVNSCYSAVRLEEDTDEDLSVAEALIKGGSKAVIAPITLITTKTSPASLLNFLEYLPLGQPFSSIMRIIRHYRFYHLDDSSYVPFIFLGDPHIRFYKYPRSSQLQITREVSDLLEYPGPKGSWINRSKY